MSEPHSLMAADGHPRPAVPPVWYPARLAAVAGVLTAIVVVVLLAHPLRRQPAGLLNSPELRSLKKELALRPGDEGLKARIREEDFRLRREFFEGQEFSERGIWLLLGAATLLLLALRAAIRGRMQWPGSRPASEEVGRPECAAGKSQAAVAAVTLLLIGAALGLGLRRPPGLPPDALGRRPSEWAAISGSPVLTPSGRSGAVIADPAAVAAGELRHPAGIVQSAAAERPGELRHPAGTLEETVTTDPTVVWPRFRGPRGDGVAAGPAAPQFWDGTTGANILWKAKVPLPGENSPVVWNHRVFLTGSDREHREVYAFDAGTGEMLWRRGVETPEGRRAGPPQVFESAGYAASTAAADGRRVYAVFANGDLAAFDFEGQRAWARNLGTPENAYGHASSLLVWRHLLLVQIDQGGGDERKSRLLALRARTGETAWQANRPVPSSWSTPLLIESAGREQIITAASPWVIAYDPATGEELWRADCLGGEVAPSPTFGGGFVYVANAFARAAAIRPDGHGDVTRTHVAWTAEDGLPDVCSPLFGDGRLYLLAESFLTVYDARTGRKLLERDLEARFQASPSLAGERLYLLTEGGVMILLDARGECPELGRCALGEEARASPAFAGDRLYLRGVRHLYGIEEGSAGKGTEARSGGGHE
ncbi:MAG: PQQ-binding-like beta-propeller repeat protein [Planctomycetes bacterium]|nr:PQQ-binding-like beta-propeller repeat protein [Planctomycetota bacterium]